MVGVLLAVVHDGMVVWVCAKATAGTLDVVVHEGTTDCVRAASISIVVGTLAALIVLGTTVCVHVTPPAMIDAVGVLAAVVQLGTVVSVSPIAIAGMLDAVVGLIKHAV